MAYPRAPQLLGVAQAHLPRLQIRRRGRLAHQQPDQVVAEQVHRELLGHHLGRAAAEHPGPERVLDAFEVGLDVPAPIVKSADPTCRPDARVEQGGDQDLVRTACAYRADHAQLDAPGHCGVLLRAHPVRTSSSLDDDPLGNAQRQDPAAVEFEHSRAAPVCQPRPTPVVLVDRVAHDQSAGGEIGEHRAQRRRLAAALAPGGSDDGVHYRAADGAHQCRHPCLGEAAARPLVGALGELRLVLGCVRHREAGAVDQQGGGGIVERTAALTRRVRHAPCQRPHERERQALASVAVGPGGAARHRLAARRAARDVLVDDPLAGAIVRERLADEHCQRTGGGVEPVAVSWGVLGEGVGETRIAKQGEDVGVVEPSTNVSFGGGASGGRVQGGWSRLRFGVATRTYLAGASHCNPCQIRRLSLSECHCLLSP